MRAEPGTDTSTWRSRAVSRSLDPARQAAEERVQRFLDAALELLSSPAGDDFTVQNVVDRSGLSLRSFYLHFAGKHELMLALFEEGIRASAEHLRTEIEPISDPLDRLQRFTTEYYRMCRSGDVQSDRPLPVRSVGNFAHTLMFDHPHEASAAFAPLVLLLRQVLEDAATAGAIRSDLDAEQVAGVILQAIMFNAFATTITGTRTDELPDRGDLLWALLIGGLAGDPGGPADP